MVANLRRRLFVSLCIVPLSAGAGAGDQHLTLTIGKSQQSLDEVVGNMSDLAYEDFNLEGDKRDTSFKLNYQNRIGSKLSWNVGWVDLGGADLQLSGNLPANKTNPEAASDIANSLPVRGRGVTADIRLHGDPSAKIDVNVGLGLFGFKDERKAFIGSSSVIEKSSGAKLYFKVIG